MKKARVLLYPEQWQNILSGNEDVLLEYNVFWPGDDYDFVEIIPEVEKFHGEAGSPFIIVEMVEKYRQEIRACLKCGNKFLWKSTSRKGTCPDCK